MDSIYRPYSRLYRPTNNKNHYPPPTWQDLLRAADAELYRVKREKKKAGVQIR